MEDKIEYSIAKMFSGEGKGKECPRCYRKENFFEVKLDNGIVRRYFVTEYEIELCDVCKEKEKYIDDIYCIYCGNKGLTLIDSCAGDYEYPGYIEYLCDNCKKEFKIIEES